jgi:hypothetical protein
MSAHYYLSVRVPALFDNVTLVDDEQWVDVYLHIRWTEITFAYLPEDLARPHLTNGRLVRVLAEWCPKFSGYHLYYPSRRQATPAFRVVVDALRYRR